MFESISTWILLFAVVMSLLGGAGLPTILRWLVARVANLAIPSDPVTPSNSPAASGEFAQLAQLLAQFLALTHKERVLAAGGIAVDPNDLAAQVATLVRAELGKIVLPPPPTT